MLGNPVNIESKWILIGIYTSELLGINPSVWSYHVDLNGFDVYWGEHDRRATLIRKSGCENVVERTLDVDIY
jgi:hypothetical protein